MSPHPLLAAVAMLLATAAAAAAPVPVIFDTDMDSDCDDVAALAMLHALADLGEARILATPVSSHHPWAAPCTDAINTYYRRPDLPIGAPKRPGARAQNSKFARQLAAEFPHDLRSAEAAPDATAVYRTVLAAQPARSVTLVTVGDLTNVRTLLESPADALSPLPGPALVAEKVRHWVCMGSRYPADDDPKPWGNFKPDPESTVRAINGWPGLLTFTGGGTFAEALATGAGLAALPATHPVRRGYELYFGGTPRDRHSADQIAVLVAVRGTGAPWKLVTEGHNHIFPDGRHEWRPTPDSPRQQYISALADGTNARSVARTLEDLMSRPPLPKQ